MLASAAMMIASTAHAEPIQIPGIVYIPTEPVTLIPSGAAGDPMCTGAGTIHSGLGCTNTVEMETTVDPFAGADTLATDLAAALAAFDVTVTTTRPPKYVPYMMINPSDTVNDMSTSFTCTGGAADCSALSRHRIGSMNGGSQNCMMPDLLHQTLYTFGRLSGLEGLDPAGAVTGVMTYIPDYTMPQSTFVDECVAIVPQQGFNDRMMQVDLPLECTSLDHTCDMGEQNSTADLTATYGAPLAAPDETAPVVEISTPMEGEVFQLGDDPIQVVLDGTITEDDSAYVGVYWTVQSDAFMDLLGTDLVEFCTNDACDQLGLPSVFDDHAAPAVLLGTDAIALSFDNPPAGSYTATLEATDMYGNVSEIATVNFTVEAAPEPGTSGADGSGSASAGDATASGGGFTTGADGGSDGTDGGSSAADGGSGDDGGCSCTTAPEQGGLTLLMFSLFGLGIARRRR
jgi:MYXO-CTERM domain-containing protein